MNLNKSDSGTDHKMRYREITVVMYHYVRDIARSRYPDIKGLTIQDFRKQLKVLQEKHTMVTVEECLDYLEDPASYSNFPDNAALLTFDDGYMEHFTEVFPILNNYGIQGAFFPPVQSASERKALDVNKIHFILAASPKPESLLIQLSPLIKKYKTEHGLLDPEEYYRRIDAKEHPYDPLNVVIFKRVLQRELPTAARAVILDELFSDIVGIREEVFVNELYMHEEHLKCMMRNGMYVGGHGYSHKWLNSIDKSEQEFEIDQTRTFLNSLGADTDNWVMCYPYGAYDDYVIEVLKAENCALAFTTEGEKGVLDPERRFRITRIDTNEV